MPEDTTATVEQAQAATEATPAAETPATPPATQQTETEIMEALFEARTTGNTTEATKLTKLLETTKQTPVQAEPVKEPEDASPVEAEATETEPVTTEPVVEPPTGEEPKDEPTEGKEPPNRIRITHLSKEDRALQTAIHALTMGGMTLTEATQRVMGGQTKQAEPEPEQVQTNPAIAQLEATVTDLESQLDATASEDGDLYGKNAVRITKELSRANAKLEAARVALPITERETAREVQSFESERNKVNAEVRKEFPAVNDESTEFFQLYRDLAMAAINPDHPDHAKSQSVDAPRFFAAKTAKILGTKGTKAPANAVPPVPAAQPPPATRPAAATKGSAPPPPAKTAADKARDAEAEFEAASTGSRTATRRIGGMIIR